MRLGPRATSLVGREGEIAEVSAMLEAPGIVTVLGPPGVGKTRLAVEIAEREAARRPGSVAACDLTEATSAADLHSALARTLDASLGEGDAIVELGKSLAARGDVLILLDNFEQLVTHATETVGRLRALAPSARILVTSRERLRLPGERVFDLEPLALPRADGDLANSDAVTLFVERTRLVRHGYEVRESDAAAVAALVRALDGLPLAIELAATRMRVLTPAQMLELMPRRFEVLSQGAGPTEHHARTLEEALEASWGLLAPVLQSALAQLSVFRGGFDLEAATAVVRVAWDDECRGAIDVLHSLCDRSLVRAENESTHPEEVRFSLYLSVRDFARGKLEALGQVADAETRHAEHYVAFGASLVGKIRSSEDTASRTRLERERDNLGAVHRRALDGGSELQVRWALSTAIALDASLQRHGPWSRRGPLLDRAIEQAEAHAHTSALLSAAYVARGMLACYSGTQGEIPADLTRALAVARAAHDDEQAARAEMALGVVHALARRVPEARAHHARVLDYARRTGATLLEGLVLGHLGSAAYFGGDLEDAAERYRASLAIFRAAGSERMIGVTLDYLANVLQEQGRLGEARALLEEALAFDRRAGNRTAEADVHGSLGEIAQAQGRLDDALEHLGTAVDLLVSLGNRRWEGQWRSALATCHEERFEYEAALTHYERAIAVQRDVGDAVHIGTTLCDLARLLVEIDDGARASQLVAEARAIAANQPYADRRLTAMIVIAEAHLELARALESGEAREQAEAARRMRHCLAETAGTEPPMRVRATCRLLARAIDARLGASSAEPPRPSATSSVETRGAGAAADDAGASDALLVGEGAAWIRAPGAERIALAKRPNLRRIVEALVERRVLAPGSALNADALIAAGWPGERMSVETGKKRLHTALWALRKLGLERALVTGEDGYFLDPRIALVRARPPVPSGMR